MCLIVEVSCELEKLAFFVKFHNGFFTNLKILNHKSLNGYYQVWGKQKDIEVLVQSLVDTGSHQPLISARIAKWNDMWNITHSDPVPYTEFKCLIETPQIVAA